MSERLTKKLGVNIVTVCSVLLTAIALYGFSTASAFWMLCLWGIPYGLGAGAIDAALNNYVALHYNSRHMSWLHCFWGVGTIISPYIMSYALTTSVWQNGYRMVSFLQMGITVILLVTLPIWKVNRKANEQKAGQAAVIGIRGALKIKGVPQLLLGFFSYCSLESTLLLWSSSYLVGAKGVTAQKAAAFASLFCIGIFGLWYYSRYEGEFLPEHPGFFRPCSIFGIILLAPATQVLTSFLISIIAMIFPAWLKAYETLIESAGMNDVTLPVICYSVLLAPFSEELIFRGVTMRQAKKVLPFWAANLFQAVLFGVFHMNIMQGIYACCLGLIMGYICEKCGSIYYSIFFHFLYNLLGTVVMTSINIGSTPASVILSFFVSVIAAVSGFLLLQVRSQKTD